MVGELARARLALDERGQKLGDLEERTAAMLSSADSFSKHAHEVCLTCGQPPRELEKANVTMATECICCYFYKHVFCDIASSDFSTRGNH